MKEHRLVVTYDPGEEGRALLGRMLDDSTQVVFLKDMPQGRRAQELSAADTLLSWNPPREIQPEEWSEIGGVRLIQLISAGADHIPFSRLPSGAQVANNGGAYAEQMAEHVLAMTLALSKRLLVEHEKLSRGEFDQGTPNRTLRGATCGILGFGGIGRATARLMRAMGMEVFALNRSGRSREPAEFMGTLEELEHILRASDVVVVSLPLSEATRGLIGARELGWMKPDAILVNVARGAIIDEEALYEHLRTHPDFMSGIDAWWVEPFRDGEFRMDHPFLELPNVLGSPHNSAMVPGALTEALVQAAENVRRYLDGEQVTGVVNPEDA